MLPWSSGNPTASCTTLVIVDALSAGKSRERGSWTMWRPRRFPGATCSAIVTRSTSPFTSNLLADGTPPPPSRDGARLSVMDVHDHIGRVRNEGHALARAAENGPLDADVPGCPGWSVDTLLRHVGDVHRWAATI